MLEAERLVSFSSDSTTKPLLRLHLRYTKIFVELKPNITYSGELSWNHHAGSLSIDISSLPLVKGNLQPLFPPVAQVSGA